MIALACPDISPLELAYVADAVASTRISSGGAYTDRFEAAWSARCGVAHTVTTSSGTSALTLVLQALDVGPGDEVIVPAFTFAAVAGAVVACGARPVVADVDPVTWCIDPRSVAAAVTPRTVGIIAVHAYGHPAPMQTLRPIADRRALWLVEDGAEAHLAELDGRVVGSLGDAAAFSFFANKIVAAGEGGAVTTDDATLAARVRMLANHGVPAGAPDRYAPAVHGTNARSSNVSCALLCAQVERAPELLSRRREIDRRYRTGASELGMEVQGVAAGATPVPWLTTVLLPADVDRDVAVDRLRDEGIEARRTFPPLCDLVPYRQRAHVPMARDLAQRGLSLPTHSCLTDDVVDTVVAALARAASNVAACEPR